MALGSTNREVNMTAGELLWLETMLAVISALLAMWPPRTTDNEAFVLNLPSMRIMLTMSYNKIVLNIIPTLYAGYIVSVHRMVTENRPVDPGSIQGSHRPILVSFT